LFDVLTSLTNDVAGVVGELEDGLGQINFNKSDKTVERVGVNNTESTPTSPFVVSLFGAVKRITGGVGKLVHGVGDHLTNNRGSVENVSQHVKRKVGGLGSALRNWVDSLGAGVRNISLSLNGTNADGEAVQIANYKSHLSVSSDNERKKKVPIIS